MAWLQLIIWKVWTAWCRANIRSIRFYRWRTHAYNILSPRRNFWLWWIMGLQWGWIGPVYEMSFIGTIPHAWNLLDACAITHLEHPDGLSSFKHLLVVSGQAISALLEVQAECLIWSLLGTLLMVFDGWNRILVQYGLKCRGHTQRAGFTRNADTAGIAANGNRRKRWLWIAPLVWSLGGRLMIPTAIDLLTGFNTGHEMSLPENEERKKSFSLSMKKLHLLWTLRRRSVRAKEGWILPGNRGYRRLRTRWQPSFKYIEDGRQSRREVVDYFALILMSSFIDGMLVRAGMMPAEKLSIGPLRLEDYVSEKVQMLLARNNWDKSWIWDTVSGNSRTSDVCTFEWITEPILYIKDFRLKVPVRGRQCPPGRKIPAEASFRSGSLCRFGISDRVFSTKNPELAAKLSGQPMEWPNCPAVDGGCVEAFSSLTSENEPARRGSVFDFAGKLPWYSYSEAVVVKLIPEDNTNEDHFFRNRISAVYFKNIDKVTIWQGGWTREIQIVHTHLPVSRVWFTSWKIGHVSHSPNS